MKPEELLKKLDRLDEIPSKGWNVRGKPNSIITVTINGESLVKRWHKRCRQYKIDLINQFKKEVCEKQREICAEKAEIDSDYLPSKDELQYSVDRYSILNAPEPD